MEAALTNQTFLSPFQNQSYGNLNFPKQQPSSLNISSGALLPPPPPPPGGFSIASTNWFNSFFYQNASEYNQALQKILDAISLAFMENKPSSIEKPKQPDISLYNFSLTNKGANLSFFAGDLHAQVASSQSYQVYGAVQSSLREQIREWAEQGNIQELSQCSNKELKTLDFDSLIEQNSCAVLTLLIERGIISNKTWVRSCGDLREKIPSILSAGYYYLTDLATLHNRPDILKLFADHGFQINRLHNDDISTLHLGVSSNSVEAVRFLLSNGEESNPTKKVESLYSHTAILPIHLVRSREMLQVLIQNGINPKLVTAEGLSLAHFAILLYRSEEPIEQLRALLERLNELGFDLNAFDIRGGNLVKAAYDLYHTELIHKKISLESLLAILSILKEAGVNLNANCYDDKPISLLLAYHFGYHTLGGPADLQEILSPLGIECDRGAMLKQAKLGANQYAVDSIPPPPPPDYDCSD